MLPSTVIAYEESTEDSTKNEYYEEDSSEEDSSEESSTKAKSKKAKGKKAKKACPDGRKAGESWKVRCNTCHCDEDGEVICTKIGCGPFSCGR